MWEKFPRVIIHSISQSHFNSPCTAGAKIILLYLVEYWPTNQAFLMIILNSRVFSARYVTTNLLSLSYKLSWLCVSVSNYQLELSQAVTLPTHIQVTDLNISYNIHVISNSNVLYYFIVQCSWDRNTNESQGKGGEILNPHVCFYPTRMAFNCQSVCHQWIQCSHPTVVSWCWCRLSIQPS